MVPAWWYCQSRLKSLYWGEEHDNCSQHEAEQSPCNHQKKSGKDRALLGVMKVSVSSWDSFVGYINLRMLLPQNRVRVRVGSPGFLNSAGALNISEEPKLCRLSRNQRPNREIYSTFKIGHSSYLCYFVHDDDNIRLKSAWVDKSMTWESGLC